MRIGCSRVRLTSAPGVAAGALVALVIANPARGGMEREVDEALQAARSGTLAPASELAGRLLAADAGDWRAWYLRALAQRDYPLDRREIDRLAEIPSEQAEVLRGLVEYVSGSPATRLDHATVLVQAYPRAALAHTLLASSFLPDGRLAEALVEARRALELDPDLFLAARVSLTALAAQRDAEALRAESCALVARFPYDSVVVDRALISCTPDPDWRLRFRDWSPVLHGQRGRTGAMLALQRLTREPSPRIWPAEMQRAVVAELDPQDPSWWPMGASLIGRLGGTLDAVDRTVLTSFLTRLHGALIAEPSPLGDAILAGASLLLSELRERDGDVGSARGVLEAAAGRLVPLQRPPLLRRLADLECAAGLPAAAMTHAVDAFVLAHPFERVPMTALPGSCSGQVAHVDASDRARQLLQSLPPVTVSAAAGEERTLAPVAATSRLVAFWSVDCAASALEVKRLVAAAADPNGPLATHALELVWVNVDRDDRHDAALASAREMGIDPARVTFAPYDGLLAQALRVAGTPALFLITPEGFVAWESRGYRTESWAPAIDRILRARSTR